MVSDHNEFSKKTVTKIPENVLNIWKRNKTFTLWVRGEIKEISIELIKNENKMKNKNMKK